MKKILTRTALSLVMCVLVLVATMAFYDIKAEQRREFWEGRLNTEIPLGSKADEIKQWAEKNGISIKYVDGRKMFSGTLEVTPGSAFMGTRYLVILFIYLDQNATSREQRVTKVAG
jgi:hypothetical protein